jgi:hypothetical protein
MMKFLDLLPSQLDMDDWAALCIAGGNEFPMILGATSENPIHANFREFLFHAVRE